MNVYEENVYTGKYIDRPETIRDYILMESMSPFSKHWESQGW